MLLHLRVHQLGEDVATAMGYSHILVAWQRGCPSSKMPTSRENHNFQPKQGGTLTVNKYENGLEGTNGDLS